MIKTIDTLYMCAFWYFNLICQLNHEDSSVHNITSFTESIMDATSLCAEQMTFGELVVL